MNSKTAWIAGAGLLAAGTAAGLYYLHGQYREEMKERRESHGKGMNPANPAKKFDKKKKKPSAPAGPEPIDSMLTMPEDDLIKVLQLSAEQMTAPNAGASVFSMKKNAARDQKIAKQLTDLTPEKIETISIPIRTELCRWFSMYTNMQMSAMLRRNIKTTEIKRDSELLWKLYDFTPEQLDTLSLSDRRGRAITLLDCANMLEDRVRLEACFDYLVNTSPADEDLEQAKALGLTSGFVIDEAVIIFPIAAVLGRWSLVRKLGADLSKIEGILQNYHETAINLPHIPDMLTLYNFATVYNHSAASVMEAAQKAIEEVEKSLEEADKLAAVDGEVDVEKAKEEEVAVEGEVVAKAEAENAEEEAVVAPVEAEAVVEETPVEKTEEDVAVDATEATEVAPVAEEDKKEEESVETEAEAVKAEEEVVDASITPHPYTLKDLSIDEVKWVEYHVRESSMELDFTRSASLEPAYLESIKKQMAGAKAPVRQYAAGESKLLIRGGFAHMTSLAPSRQPIFGVHQGNEFVFATDIYNPTAAGATVNEEVTTLTKGEENIHGKSTWTGYLRLKQTQVGATQPLLNFLFKITMVCHRVLNAEEHAASEAARIEERKVEAEARAAALAVAKAEAEAKAAAEAEKAALEAPVDADADAEADVVAEEQDAAPVQEDAVVEETPVEKTEEEVVVAEPVAEEVVIVEAPVEEAVQEQAEEVVVVAEPVVEAEAAVEETPVEKTEEEVVVAEPEVVEVDAVAPEEVAPVAAEDVDEVEKVEEADQE